MDDFARYRKFELNCDLRFDNYTDMVFLIRTERILISLCKKTPNTALS